MPQFQDNIYTGLEVAEYINNISVHEEDIPTGWLIDYVISRTFELKVIDIEEVFKDQNFVDYFDMGTPRYHYSEADGFYFDLNDNPIMDVSEETLYLPIVMVDNMIIDGYSRIMALLETGATTIEAFVNID